jgi:hypothetical protein
MPSPRLIYSFNRPSVAGLLAWLALTASLTVAASLAVAVPALADDPGWPRQFDSPSGSFVIYQPQPEDLKGDVLTGRTAFSLKKSGDAYPTFGVLWYTEQIQIDRDSSTVAARSLDVTKVRLPGITRDEASRYETLVETEAAGWDLSGSLEELQAGLAAAEKERTSVAGIDNAPPRILFHDRRSILVVYDGVPVLRPIERSNLERAVNTPYAVVFDPRSRLYYLNGANLWYQAKDPLGPWTDIPSPPTAIREIVPPDTSSSDQVEGPPPDVVTATEPTELIATDGPTRYAPLVADELLYVTNTESDVVLEVSTQHLYVLISGRWFRAPSTDGPWTFVRGDQLPVSFKQVPLDSPKGNILASVPGTDQAEDAVADAEIPQTSAIQRSDRSFEVTYDGDPQFAPIEGTGLEYAVNTDAEVILADGRYYACDQGVWYISDDPDVPWSVSDTRPLGLEDIPPSCPVYDVRYVYVYDSTPDVVYVGYLPGYLGCYPYYGTVVYGTGYHYSSWRSRHQYYPRRFTWGFHARYNPWLSRWSFGSSYGSGFFRVGTRWRSNSQVARSNVRSKWFGPSGYRRPLIAEDMTLLRIRRPGRTRPRVSDGLPANVYNRQENVARVDRTFNRTPPRSIAPRIARQAPVPDDVFAGKDGKVYRRDPKGMWQVRTGSAWKQTNLPIPPPAAPPPGDRESGSPLTPSQPEPSRQHKGGPAVERSVRQRNNPPERPTPPRERPAPPPERPAPPPERPAPPSEQPAPPSERPTPGDLERDYRARERSGPGDNSGNPQPTARPEPPQQESPNSKAQESQRERPPRPSKENSRSERNR